MHHASAMICTLLPSIMVSEYHRSFTLPQNLDWISDVNILKQMISNEQYKII